ncbi:L,D-transpeptidase [Pseudochelatococcus lubricantis]|uniref:L,D-transpeptidase family protein n=1 Tax=Pseudochelatococcus lubricantis TaxID=1538102 RepID=UPI0035ECB0AC
MKKSTTFSRIRVFAGVGDRRRGRIAAGQMTIACALGKGGIAAVKREGDGVTPAGVHHAVRGWYRADRLHRPATTVPLAPLRADDGWCDEPGHRLYNRPVRLPFPARHERMWRDDRLYDIVLDLGWNARPRVQGRGSAIFLHLARENFGPTEGCVAVPRARAARLLAVLGPRTTIVVGHNARPVRRSRPKAAR